MRAWGAVLAAAAILSASVAAHAEQALREWKDKPTPKLALHDLSGKEVDLASFKGRVVLVNFWATWCEPCIAEMPSIQRLQTTLGAKPFTVLAVNYGESSAKVQAWLKKSGIGLHVLMDPDTEAADAWGAKGLPMTFLVDAGGHVRYQTFGERDWTGGESVAVIDKLVAEAHGAGR